HYEVDLLEKYNFHEAIGVLQDFLKVHPDDTVARLRLSNIGLKYGFANLIDGRVEVLPQVESFSAIEHALATVQILRFTKQPDAALRYAYQLLRLHFGEPDAHRSMLIALGPFGEKPTVSQPQLVEPGTAVAFIEESGSSERWVVIEDEYPV